MESYKKSIQYLFGLQKYGIKFGLEKTIRLLELLDNPQEKFPAIHIAGTNGKGSTSAMIASVLTASGYKTGLYTSPHLVKFNERIRIDGIMIPDEEIIKYVNVLKKYFEKLKPTFFEAATIIAFKYFADKKVDIAVIETGMGGRLDATNVLNPMLCIITSISRDHTQYLGDTLTKIAFEKAGIIKSGISCILSIKNKSLLNIFQKVANLRNSQLINIIDQLELEFTRHNITHSVVNIKLKTQNKFINGLKVDLPGKFQKDNILISLAALYFLRENYNLKHITEKSIRNGFKNIKVFSGLRGRLDILSSSPMILGDVAHNPDAFKKLAETLLKLGLNRVITIFGVMKDKEIEPIVPEIIRFSKIVIAAQPKTNRAMESEIIHKEFQKRLFPCINGKSVKNSLIIAKKMYKRDEIILITGSHHTLGEAIKTLNS